jgi:hypothetical protein
MDIIENINKLCEASVGHYESLMANNLLRKVMKHGFNKQDASVIILKIIGEITDKLKDDYQFAIPANSGDMDKSKMFAIHKFRKSTYGHLHILLDTLKIDLDEDDREIFVDIKTYHFSKQLDEIIP